jgi:hypothetical protein
MTQGSAHNQAQKSGRNHLQQPSQTINTLEDLIEILEEVSQHIKPVSRLTPNIHL